MAFYCPIPWNRTRLFQDSLLAIFVSSPLNDRSLLLRPLTSVRHQFGVQSTPTIPYGESFQVFRTIKETPIGFMCSTNCFVDPKGLEPSTISLQGSSASLGTCKPIKTHLTFNSTFTTNYRMSLRVLVNHFSER